MSDCIFCKIVNKEIPAEIIYEDDKVIAFLDIKPAVKGHTLLITKIHCQDFLSLPDDLIAHLFQQAKKIAPAIIKGSTADGFNLGVNNGSSAGQMINHCHLHIIPRYPNDGLSNWPGRDYEIEERKKYGEAIRQHLK